MEDQLKERIWTLSDSDEVASDCQACEEALRIGDEVAECPRCRTLHHLACWTRRGGCARHGCPQTADESLTENLPPKGDPPVRDTLAWLPSAITVVLLVLAVIGIVWSFVHEPSSEGHVTIMMTTGSDLDHLQALANDFGNAHEELEVSLIVLPADSFEMYEQKLVTMLVAKDPPDIIMLPHSRFVAYATRGALTSLEVIKEAVAEAVPYGERLANGEVDGKLYGIPHPSRPVILAIPASSHNVVEATGLILHIATNLPFVPDVDDLAQDRLSGTAPDQLNDYDGD